jgi:predicted membrane chloride channel (bestrophin family)
MQAAAATSFNNNLHSLQDASVQLRRIATTPSKLAKVDIAFGLALTTPHSPLRLPGSLAHGDLAVPLLLAGKHLVVCADFAVLTLLFQFQIYDNLKWITIPATCFAAFLFLGFLEIGAEIENPCE